MKLAYVEVSGFRGYQKTVRVNFGEQFTIIDGRNGVGKSTIFDAIEYGITGSLDNKYNIRKAAGETIDNYLWWAGHGSSPAQRYVEIGFRGASGDLRIRREQLASPDPASLKKLEDGLCDPVLAPSSPLVQLCTSTIIRDEQITNLSLDMTESERYSLLRDALGANDSESWIARAAALVSAAKSRTSVAQSEVKEANGEVAAAARRLDEVRASLATDAAIADASSRLRAFLDTEAPPDQLVAPARERIASLRSRAEALESLLSGWSDVDAAAKREAAIRAQLDGAQEQRKLANEALRAASEAIDLNLSSSLALHAQDLADLITLGRRIGLHDNRCPLCSKGQSHAEFEVGLRQAEERAISLNERAIRQANAKDAVAKAKAGLDQAEQVIKELEGQKATVEGIIARFESRRAQLAVASVESREGLKQVIAELHSSVQRAEKDVRVLETLRLNEALETALRKESEAKTRLARAQEQFGRSRKAETGCQALHDAARRAASETLDQRLEQVLPLMSELYRRLRPHPVWSDIEYSLRGDVRRFLRLQVGNGLNPQFLFSSGQRRATGLAFLLSVNLSLAWSRWRTILLDDPVQHVDDFRSIHLAELLAQLVASGRQIICSVEDVALADLLGRRLPVAQSGTANRVTLGHDSDGALAKIDERTLLPLPQRAVVIPSDLQAAS